jgi:hypothetical protein
MGSLEFAPQNLSAMMKNVIDLRSQQQTLRDSAKQTQGGPALDGVDDLGSSVAETLELVTMDPVLERPPHLTVSETLILNEFTDHRLPADLDRDAAVADREPNPRPQLQWDLGRDHPHPELGRRHARDVLQLHVEAEDILHRSAYNDRILKDLHRTTAWRVEIK